MTARKALATAPDEEFDGLASELRARGARYDTEGLTALIRGVASAAPTFEPDAWMRLVADEPLPELREMLATLLAEERQRRHNSGSDGSFGGPVVETAVRLAALRAELRRRRLTGFVIPRGDEHQGEYVAAHSERLAWLTGFTGSAGVAVVLRDQAALFVDGRYTAQAAVQVDTALFEVRHITQQPMNEWLAVTLPAKGRLGYDPWLHTPTQAAALHLACGKA